jgi:hypothetical protein
MANLFPPCRRALPATLLLGLAVAGCGGKLQPVRGTVAFEDGEPITAGMVVFESKDGQPAVTSRGEIQADGSYHLGTYRAGDGAPAGVYRVLVSPPAPEDPSGQFAKPPFDKRYMDFNSSGLEFEVRPGSNEFPIRVARNQQRGR